MTELGSPGWGHPSLSLRSHMVQCTEDMTETAYEG